MWGRAHPASVALAVIIAVQSDVRRNNLDERRPVVAGWREDDVRRVLVPSPPSPIPPSVYSLITPMRMTALRSP